MVGKNITIKLSEETRDRMEKYPWVKWSEVCKEAIEKKVDELVLAKL